MLPCSAGGGGRKGEDKGRNRDRSIAFKIVYPVGISIQSDLAALDYWHIPLVTEHQHVFMLSSMNKVEPLFIYSAVVLPAPALQILLLQCQSHLANGIFPWTRQ